MPIQLNNNKQRRFNVLDKLVSENGVEDLLIYLAVEHGITLQPKVAPDLEKVPVMDALRTFEEEDLDLRPKTTQRTYKSELQQFRRYLVAKELQRKELAECFTGRVLSEFLYQAGGSDSTQNKKRSFLRAMQSFFVDLNWIPKLDLNEVLRLVKVYHRIPRALDKESVDELLDIARRSRYGLRYFTLFVFMIGTGTRIEEATTLRWGEIMWDDGEMKVYGKHHRNGRTVYGSEEVMRLLFGYGKLMFGANSHDWNPNTMSDLYVFSATNGRRPISIRTVQEVFGNCVQDMRTITDAMKEHLTPHSLRHTFAVNFLRAGGDIFTLSQLLGHANPKTTTIYARLTNQELINAADMVAEYILGGD